MFMPEGRMNGRVCRKVFDFSVQPLCSLCLCGYWKVRYNNHIDTENAEVAQRSELSAVKMCLIQSHYSRAMSQFESYTV